MDPLSIQSSIGQIVCCDKFWNTSKITRVLLKNIKIHL